MNATPAQAHLTVDGELHVPLAEARRRLGISRKTAYRWRDKGWLTFVKHDGRIWCPEVELTVPRPEGESE
jgi:hypothetical protein